ncbi:MAG: hypothetical protein EXS36_06835 [Pedosphaera sp.]|nr:hypothetical protein [Pedosphaera sp.]
MIALVGAVFLHGGDADWASYRRDAALSGHSPLHGGLAQPPRELWSIDLGGPSIPAETVRVEDVTGDGRDDVLRISKDRLICQDLRGQTLWQVGALSSPSILEIRDFAGDGGRGLVVEDNTGTEVRTWIIDGRTGARSELTRRRNVFGFRHRFGSILPGVRGQQYCHWWDGQDNELTGPIAHGDLWSFEDGVSHPRSRFHVDVSGVIYSAQHLFADLDGDGRNEMVLVSNEQMWVYDLATGRQKGFTRWQPSIRSYASAMALVSLARGELPSLILINPHIPGLEVLRWEGTNLARTWKKVIGPEENQYQQRVQIREALPDPFLDLDQDGRMEILATITNEHEDGLTWLAIFDALSGERLLDQPGLVIVAAEDLDGDGKLEILLREKDVLRITHWDGHHLIDRWRGNDVTPEIRPPTCDRDLARGAVAGPACNPTILRDATFGTEFIFGFGKNRWNCRLVPGGSLERARPTPVFASPVGGLPNGARRDTWNWEGTTLVTKSNQQTLSRYTVPTERTYMAPPALVGSVSGQRRVIVRNAEGTLLSYGIDGKDPRPLLQHSPAFTQSEGLYYTHLASASICDLKGDGENLVVACTRGEDGRPSVVAVDGRGQIQRRFVPPEDTLQLALGPTGALGAGRGRWLVVRCVRKFKRDAVVAFDGRTGEQLWLRDYYNVDGRTTKFVLHSPAAVFDYNHDGSDDLIALSENFYGIISVRDNHDLVEPIDITASLRGHWPAFATPILVPRPGGESPRVFLSRAYAAYYLIELDGRPVWHSGSSRDTTPRNHAAPADLDGDGRVEIVTAQADGVLRAFGAESVGEKCPICPPADVLNGRNRAGHVRWTFRIPAPIGGGSGANQNSDQDFASADLDGDGRVEILIGGGDGRLYALKEIQGECTVLWSVDLGRRVGSPILTDVDGDGIAEILVPTEDGRMHCLGRSSSP